MAETTNRSGSCEAWARIAAHFASNQGVTSTQWVGTKPVPRSVSAKRSGAAKLTACEAAAESARWSAW